LFKNISEKPAFQKDAFLATFLPMVKDSASGNLTPNCIGRILMMPASQGVLLLFQMKKKSTRGSEN
jgi:hypothetical protein